MLGRGAHQGGGRRPGRTAGHRTYKAEAAGITVTPVNEAYTSQTCPGTLPDGTACLHCSKPTGRV